MNQFVYADDVPRALVAALECPVRSGGVAYNCNHPRIDRELGVEMATRNRRMLEEYWAWWQHVPDHSPRRYQREDRALAALGLLS
jgi:nucleoside-diphosphate-sugar epimerase